MAGSACAACPRLAAAYADGMATQVRRCRSCREPIRAPTRPDALYCGPACAARARRERRRFADGVAIGFYMIFNGPDAIAVRCPVCGCRFLPGRGHRRDAVFDRPACRVAAHRARRTGKPLREGVTPNPSVGTAAGPLTRANAFPEAPAF
ncbi:hypothetical protein GCM10010315_33970 [Streptomyces luteosporeus]|uniref:DUF2116 family Zn-ribbon domain-containing protein n=1 Tax=Streptomyces luteosporeus TaxID=173856 RepID=A0ABN3TTS3_9ACTN